MEAYGSRNLEKKLPMQLDTQFRIASLTRVLSGATILTLTEDGTLGLNDAVAKYIPEFATTPVIKSVEGDKVITEPQKTPLTVRHLFTYTGGFGYAPDWPKSLGLQQDMVIGLDGTLQKGVKTLAKYPLLNQPGAKWHYGFSGDVLGAVAEVAAKKEIDVILKERMLDKLGMKDTGYWTKDADRIAVVYGPDEKTGKLVTRNEGADGLSSFTRPGTLKSAGGGLLSTVPDYLRFAQMLLNEGQLDGVRVMKPETVKAMISRQTTADQGLVYWYQPDRYTTFKGYAWGYAIGVRVEGTHALPGNVGDAGWAGFTNTWFFIDPKTQVTGVAMTQYLGPDQESVVIKRLREGIYAALAK
jgi:CubicO group peptidase (beta-lactamase class C family)